MKTLTTQIAFAVAVITLALPASVEAQQRGYSLNTFNASERGSEWFAADSLDFRGDLRPAVGLVGEWAYRTLVSKRADGKIRRSVVRNQFVLHPGVSLVIRERLRLGLDVPLQAYADGKGSTIGDTTFAPPENKTSLGDVRLAADVRLVGRYGEPVTLAAGLQATLPTGDRDSYSGDGVVRLTPQVMVAGDIRSFVYAARLGVTIRTKEREFGDSYSGSFASLAVAAGARLLDKRLVVGPELFMQSVVTHSQFFEKNATPLEGLLGAHYTFANGLRAGAGFGVGITRAYGAPRHRGYLMVEWAPRVEEPATPPPEAPPLDRDQDGVLDDSDACPDQPGQPTSDPATNGCPPPPDRDQDGIADAQDACPDETGVANADPQKNGCPVPADRDQDGIVDAQDACPDEAGVANADPQKNGCPAPADRDQDGVLDPDDACPDAAGEASEDPKRNGCPKAFVEGSQIKILDQVKFKKNKAEILPGPESEDVLTAVLQVLNEHPELNLIHIEGHTDNTGSAARNRELSKQRAQSVLDWLVKHGVAANRLTAEGFGSDRPIDTNETEEGRQNNRRVDFQIVGAK
jgi:outer membrane protein OmpA-like peptidoglycan-associated protein